MGRYIFNGVTGLSLLPCLVTVMLWVPGNQMSDMLSYHSRHAGYMLGAHNTGIEYNRWPQDLDAPKFRKNQRAQNPSEGWHFLRTWSGEGGSGFTYQHQSGSGYFSFGLPYWLICLITALAPGIWITRRLRCHRRGTDEHR